MCSALGVTRQGHCAWRKRPPSARTAGRRTRVNDSGDPRGELRDLRRPEGLRRAAPAGREHLAQTRRAGITRRRAKRPKGESKQAASQANAAPDPVRREFSADGPDRPRFADITYVGTHQGRPHLAIVMGIWSRMIAERSRSPRMTAAGTSPRFWAGPCAAPASSPRWDSYRRRGATQRRSRSWAS